MIVSRTILTRRSLFRAGAGLAVVATATPLLNTASAQSQHAREAGAEPLNGNGFYRFKIGGLPGNRDLGWLWADSDLADLRYERL